MEYPARGRSNAGAKAGPLGGMKIETAWHCTLCVAKKLGRRGPIAGRRCESATFVSAECCGKSTVRWPTWAARFERGRARTVFVARSIGARGEVFPCALTVLRDADFSSFLSPNIWRSQTAEYNSVRRRDAALQTYLAWQFDGTFGVTRNRILLGRAIEEAEGYTELGMLEHALRRCSGPDRWCTEMAGRVTYWARRCRDLARYEEALPPLERSADLLPDDIHILLALGWCYKRTGQLAKAIEVLERAVRVDSSEAVLHYNLACYWSLARNRSLALRYLSRALEIDTNFRDMISDEPDFNLLRHDAQFIALVERDRVKPCVRCAQIMPELRNDLYPAPIVGQPTLDRPNGRSEIARGRRAIQVAWAPGP